MFLVNKLGLELEANLLDFKLSHRIHFKRRISRNFLQIGKFSLRF